MKKLWMLTFLVTFSCSQISSQRSPAQIVKKSCFEIMRPLIKDRPTQEDFVHSAKRHFDLYDEVRNDPQFLEIVGEMSDERKEMALLSLAALKQNHPSDSPKKLKSRYLSLKSLCIGP